MLSEQLVQGLAGHLGCDETALRAAAKRTFGILREDRGCRTAIGLCEVGARVSGTVVDLSPDDLCVGLVGP